jgi:hypothetical protein
MEFQYSPSTISIALKVETGLAGRVIATTIAGVPSDRGEAAFHLGTLFDAADGFANVT